MSSSAAVVLNPAGGFASLRRTTWRLDRREEFHEPARCRARTGSTLGIHRQRRDVGPGHGATQFPFQQGLHQERQKVDR